MQEGLHEHTPARITSRRGSRHHGIDGGSLALGTTTTSMACIAACIACLCTAMATSYNLCTYSIISTPSTHLLPHVAPPPAAPIPLHHTDSAPCASASSGCSPFSQRKRRCSSPFPLRISAFSWRTRHWQLYLVRDQPSSPQSPSSSSTIPIPPMEPAACQAAFAFILANYIPVQSCFQADEAAIRHTARKTTTSTSE